ncbi:MAG: NTP transferase domain-containing protein [Candidatus Binatia bacterium]
MSAFVSGLVLAAGTSSRLGKRTKQLLPWRGTTVLEWVIKQVETSPLDEVVVVIGHEAEEVRRSVTVKRARFVEATDFHEGCSASIRAGLEAIDRKAEAAALILADQPGLEHETIAAVMRVWQEMKSPVVRVSYRGRSGHPMLFAAALFEQLKALHGDKGVWKLLATHPEWVREVEVDRSFPGDMDTWEDYVKLSSALPS